MLHNLDPRTAYSVNSVFWTLAVEEQLYLLYFLLLWLRNRWGWGVSLLICFSARLVWFVICMAIFQRTGTAPPIEEMSLSHWFEWALGAVSVEWALGLIELPAYARSATAGASVLCIAAALTYMHRVVDISTPINNAIWAMETPVWGVGCFLILNFLVDRERCWRKVGPPPWSIGLLASVGIFSYSLYLTHLIIVDSYAKSWRDWQQAPGIWQMLSTLVLLPLCCIAFAWLFYQVVERHFLPKGTANRNQLLEKR
jgi:peptidoglycan/LPS O-acetylase OafA/YrhL